MGTEQAESEVKGRTPVYPEAEFSGGKGGGAEIWF